ncbi:MAG: hypothetical protein ACTSSE_02525 [Candidatus Thorarchaeota archaeon]
METIPKILLHSLEHESRQARFVLAAAKDTDLKFTPKDELKPLVDLANHLAQIPTIDFKFFSMDFKTFEEAQAMEKELRRDTIDDLLALFDQGLEKIKEYVSKLTDEQIQENNLKAFYEDGPAKSWSHYIPEITTHLAMHKMQLWMYLKLAGAPVSMWTYYGVPKSE